jgi:hypothetical protein
MYPKYRRPGVGWADDGATQRLSGGGGGGKVDNSGCLAQSEREHRIRSDEGLQNCISELLNT